MISREGAVAKIKEQMERKTKIERHSVYHYGYIELRELLDYIYEQEPTTEEEKLMSI